MRRNKKRAFESCVPWVMVFLIVYLLVFNVLQWREVLKLKNEKEDIVNFYNGRKEFVENYLSGADSVMGTYNIEYKHFIVYTNHGSLKDVILTSYHEICHYIWNEFLDYEQRLEYVEIINTDAIRSGAEEKFADECAEWFYSGRLKNNLKNQFMVKNIQDINFK